MVVIAKVAGPLIPLQACKSSSDLWDSGVANFNVSNSLSVIWIFTRQVLFQLTLLFKLNIKVNVDMRLSCPCHFCLFCGTKGQCKFVFLGELFWDSHLCAEYTAVCDTMQSENLFQCGKSRKWPSCDYNEKHQNRLYENRYI